MRYYIEKQKTHFIVTNLDTNKKLESPAKTIYGGINRALFDAYTNHGTIQDGMIKSPEKTVQIYYKDGWAQIDKIEYKYGCKFFLNKVKDKITSTPTQMSLFG